MKSINYLNSIIGHFLIFILFILFISLKLSNSQEVINLNTTADNEHDRWEGLLQKYQIHSDVLISSEHIYISGSKITKNSHLATIEDAVFIMINTDKSYHIINSPLATYNIEMKSIKGKEGVLENFKSDNNKKDIYEKIIFKDFEYQINEKTNSWTAKSIKGEIKI